MSRTNAEQKACQLGRVRIKDFNPSAGIPYGCTVEHVCEAMNEFLSFLEFINTQLHGSELPRLECFLMPANFSSIVGEFMTATLPKHCSALVKNKHHNGHPDLLPKAKYPRDSVLHGAEGIEVKASRYARGWQGHNPESVWLMVFVFAANRITDEPRNKPPVPFRFVKVVGAKLDESDWRYSGRSETSRRTITASVTQSGFEKMEANWIYRAPDE